MIPQNKSSVCLRIHVLLSYLCNVLLGVDQRFWLTTRRDYRVWWHSQLRWGRRYILHLRLYYLWWRTMVLWRHCGRLLCATLTAESGSKTYSAWHVLCMGSLCLWTWLCARLRSEDVSANSQPTFRGQSQVCRSCEYIKPPVQLSSSAPPKTHT